MHSRFLHSVVAFLAMLVAQPVNGEIRWQSGAVELPRRTPAEAAGALTMAAARGEAGHCVVQFEAPVGPELSAQLQAAGVSLLSYLGDHAYFAATDPAKLNPTVLAGVTSLTRVSAIDLVWKMHPDFVSRDIPSFALRSSKEAKDSEGPAAPDIVAAYVMFHRDVPLEPIGTSVAWRHGARIRSYLRSINGLVIELPLANLDALTAEDAVMWIEPPLPPLNELNNSNRIRTGADIVQAPPYGLDGSGIKVLVYDGGYGLASHQDFGGRLTVRDTSGLSDHSTHVAGTVGGSGAGSSGNYKGMAPAVTIESYGFEQAGGLQEGFLYTDPGDLEQDYSQAINTYGADISNNSIGTNTAPNGYPCTWEGNYGATSALIDTIVRGDGSNPLFAEPFRIVWANGNERQTSRCLGIEGFPSPYHSTAPPACAKNHITVGAMNSNDDSVTSFTSFGPSDDGRIKPDISAPGCQSNEDNGVTSCSSSGGYTAKCGTSMASPTVCGLGALLLQDYRAQYPDRPDFRNSTLKVWLAHTAVDIEEPGPDYKTGYGSVRIQPAIDFMRSGNFLEGTVAHGQSVQLLAIVNPGDPQVKVTLAWDDVPGTPDVMPVLVNDLDLRVFDPANNLYYPWTLAPMNPSAPAVQNAPDHANNIEQVVINTPTPGAYRIEVLGYNIPQGPQPFSISVSPMLVACSSMGVISLDRAKYPCAGADATIQVVDCDLNTDDDLVETVQVSIASTTESAGETVLLTETGPQTATFRGSIPLSTSDSVGVLQITAGDTITATYTDADDGQGGLNIQVTTNSSVDCTPPVISNPQASNIQPRSATVSFDTDEPANGLVRYGAACGTWLGTLTESGYKTAHTFNLTGLTDNTTYYFAVEATDPAGNSATDDNGGACYAFTTPEIPDYFTEEFTGDHDLDNQTLTLTPNGTYEYYSACIEPIIALPTDPAGGTTLSLSDDSYATVSLTGGATVSLYGLTYSALYVGSNGYVTFTAGDPDYTESLADHFDTPRVSALFDDLNPSQAGTVSWKQLADRVAVTWLNVTEHNGSNQNTFQIELYFDGRIVISWLACASGDNVVGLSAGNGVPGDFYESDLSAVGACGPRPPAAAGQYLQGPVSLPINIALSATDDGLPDPPAALTYLITTLPAAGNSLVDSGNAHLILPEELPYTLVNNGNQVVYQPAPAFYGSDGFQFKANDGGIPPEGGDSNIAAVSMLIQYGPPVITTTALPDGYLNHAYGPFQLLADEGQPPLAWSLVSVGAYVETDLGVNQFALVGTAQNWRADDASWSYTLPFAFPYYGTDYTAVWVCSNGFLDFTSSGAPYLNSDSGLIAAVRIAPMWDDLETDQTTGHDIYIDSGVSGQVTIRWQGATYSSSGSGYPVNFSVTLHSDGKIRFHYGSGNTNLTPTIGVSSGNGTAYTLSSYNNYSTLTNASSHEFAMPAQFPAGLTVSPAGVVSGTPTEYGAFSSLIKVIDALNRSHQRTIPLVIHQTPPPDPINCDNVAGFDFPTELPCFVNAILGIEDYPGSIARCDLNGDSATNGADVAPWVECVVNGHCP